MNKEETSLLLKRGNSKFYLVTVLGIDLDVVLYLLQKITATLTALAIGNRFSHSHHKETIFR
jgi:hypothetical protein